jgi:hypothetical protein
MRTLFRSTLIALAVLTSASAAMARPHNLPASKADAGTNAGSANANSPESVRTFWDDMKRWGN